MISQFQSSTAELSGKPVVVQMIEFALASTRRVHLVMGARLVVGKCRIELDEPNRLVRLPPDRYQGIVDTAVACLPKAVVVNPCEPGEGTDAFDPGPFR